jgi:hypothetical protein
MTEHPETPNTEAMQWGLPLPPTNVPRVIRDIDNYKFNTHPDLLKLDWYLDELYGDC